MINRGEPGSRQAREELSRRIGAARVEAKQAIATLRRLKLDLWRARWRAAWGRASQKCRVWVDTLGLGRVFFVCLLCLLVWFLAIVAASHVSSSFVAGVTLAVLAVTGGGVALASLLVFPGDEVLAPRQQEREDSLSLTSSRVTAQATVWRTAEDALAVLLAERAAADARQAAVDAATAQYRKSQRYQSQQLAGAQWRDLRGYDFEDYLAEVFRNLGYGVEQIGQSGDQGVDLIVVHKGSRIAVQAKGYEGSVGNSAIQEVFTGRQVHGCHGCAVVTNSRFTTSALQAAEATGCVLVHEENFEDFVFGKITFS